IVVGGVGFVFLLVAKELRHAAALLRVVASAREAGHLSFAGPGCPARAAARALLADLQQELAVFGEFQELGVRGAVAADPDIALIVDENPVVGVRPLEPFAGPAPMPQKVALRI